MGREPWHVHGEDYILKAIVAAGFKTLPAECAGAFRAVAIVDARFRSSNHTGWWLSVSSGPFSLQSFREGQSIGLGGAALRNGEVGCLEEVRLSYSVKVINMTDGATAARRAIRPRAEALTCGGRAAAKAPRRSASRLLAEPEEPQRSCAEAGVAAPLHFGAVVHFRPDAPKGSWGRETWKIRYFYRAMPPECRGVVRRLTFDRPQIQGPLDHKRWLNSDPQGWALMETSEQGGWGGSSWSASVAPPPGKKWPTGPEYACTPGKAVTEARVGIKATAQAREPGHRQLASHVYLMPAKVIGAC